MKVTWTDEAIERLEEIEDFIARRSSRKRAERFVTNLIDETDRLLARHPRSGHRLPEMPGASLRERRHGNYRIVYRVRRSRVEILTVFEGHRLLQPDELTSDESE